MQRGMIMKKYLKKLVSPELSLVLMCCVPAAAVWVKNGALRAVFILLLTSAAVLISAAGFKKGRKSPALLITQIAGSVLYASAYAFAYDKITPKNTLNFIFALISLVLLVPYITEIAKTAGKKA